MVCIYSNIFQRPVSTAILRSHQNMKDDGRVGKMACLHHVTTDHYLSEWQLEHDLQMSLIDVASGSQPANQRARLALILSTCWAGQWQRCYSHPSRLLSYSQST